MSTAKRNLRMTRPNVALIGAVSLCVIGLSPKVFAQTQAASAISNVAQANFLLDGAPHAITSNIAAFSVVELLDIGLDNGLPALPAGSGAIALPFTLRNLGNGQEAFLLAGSASAGGVTGFAVDSDGDGSFVPARDAVLAHATTPPLAPGATVAIFALVDADAGATVTVQARATTASGTPGSTAIGGGDGGVDALVGKTSASASLRFSIGTDLAGSTAAATLEKNQSISASNGEDAPMRGATILYTLTARFTRGTALDAVVSDPVPAGTRYVPGSLTLDGATLSDAADSDPGNFDGTAIRAALGTVAAPATHVIQFKVSIQ